MNGKTQSAWDGETPRPNAEDSRTNHFQHSDRPHPKPQPFRPRTYLNLGILAHIDAGKTSLTERLLFETSAISELGSVDEGTTQTDTDSIERRRGITIRTAVASFHLGDWQVNVVDTPGHVEFVAEVERSLLALDAVILVVSAVEGVQPHTRVLFNAASSSEVPTIVFINKVDRNGSRFAEVVKEVEARLGRPAVPLSEPKDEGTAEVSMHNNLSSARFHAVWERLAMVSEVDFNFYLDTLDVSLPHLRSRLSTLIPRDILPVTAGSARTGAGVPELLDALMLLPGTEPTEDVIEGEPFSVQYDKDGTRSVLVRLRKGAIRPNQRNLAVTRYNGESGSATEKVRLVKVEALGPSFVPEAGNIVSLQTRPPLTLHDRVGMPQAERDSNLAALPQPTIETIIRPAANTDPVALYRALSEIADRDPMISLRPPDDDGIRVRLFGPIQAEVIAETLVRDYGLRVGFSRPSPLYFERLKGIGTYEIPIRRAPFTAGLGVSIAPNAPGQGTVINLDVAQGRMPNAFRDASKGAFVASLQQARYGWPLIDSVLTLTLAQYDNATSTGSDFRLLAPIVLQRAIQLAGTEVLEPLAQFTCHVPLDNLQAVLVALERSGSSFTSVEIEPTDTESWLILGEMPAHRASGFTPTLPNLTSGMGSWSYRLQGYRTLSHPPQRPRTDGNPARLTEYMHYLTTRGIRR